MTCGTVDEPIRKWQKWLKLAGLPSFQPNVLQPDIHGPVLRLSTPPHGLGPQVVAPIPFYLQAIGSISEVQRRIC